jgi:hypothetical protein
MGSDMDYDTDRAAGIAESAAPKDNIEQREQVENGETIYQTPAESDTSHTTTRVVDPRCPSPPPGPSHLIPLEPTAVEPMANARRTRKRKLAIREYTCVCGDTVLEDEREDKLPVAKCSARGCETIWVRFVSMLATDVLNDGLQYHLRCLDDGDDWERDRWACAACRPRNCCRMMFPTQQRYD